MEHQKRKNLIYDASNQPSQLKTKIWVKINDESRKTYNANSQIKFKTIMLKSSLCDYSDAYILVTGTITVNNTAAVDPNASNATKKVIIKNFARCINCISEINNTQVGNAKDINIEMAIRSLIEYSDNYSKTSGSLWQYCKDIPAVNNIGVIANLNGNNATD